MANFERIGIGGVPVGKGKKSNKTKYSLPCTEYTNIMNGENVMNKAVFLNTEKYLNTEKALNDYTRPMGKFWNHFTMKNYI